MQAVKLDLRIAYDIVTLSVMLDTARSPFPLFVPIIIEIELYDMAAMVFLVLVLSSKYPREFSERIPSPMISRC